jgi:hypothetical protein
MAFPYVSSTNKNTIRSALQSPQNIMWRNSCRTHDPNKTDIWWIGKPADPGQVGCPIGAPITDKGKNLGLKGHIVLLYWTFHGFLVPQATRAFWIWA